MSKWKKNKFNIEDFSKMYTSLIILRNKLFNLTENVFDFVILYISAICF
jgi:hypothetical protein